MVSGAGAIVDIGEEVTFEPTPEKVGEQVLWLPRWKEQPVQRP